MTRQSDAQTGQPGGDPPARGPGGDPASRPLPADRHMQVIRDRLRLFLVLILGLLVVMSQDLPFRLAGIVLAAGALWVGVRLLAYLGRLRRAGSRTPGAITLITGLSLSAILLFLLIADAVYYPLVSDLETCQAGANTQSARDICQREARGRIDDLLERLSGQP